MANIALFLGAGFSVYKTLNKTTGHEEIWLPTMAQFGDQSDRWLAEVNSTHANPNSSLYRKIGEKKQAAGQAYEDFRHWCVKSRPVASIADKNLEDMMTFAEMLEQTGCRSIQLPERILTLQRLRTEMATWIWHAYQNARCFYDTHDLEVRHKPLPAQARFVDTILKSHSSHHITVITVNYDILFESLCWRKGALCRYPDSIQSANTLRVEVTCDDIPFNNPLAQMTTCHTSGIEVCKLHGSVNYFAPENGHPAQTVSVCDQIIPTGCKVGRSVAKARQGVACDRPILYMEDAIYFIRQRELVPQFIPPTYGKLRTDQWLRNIWQHAATELRDADRILFVGYSFPRSDGFITALLQASSVQRDPEKDPPHVCAINPDRAALLRCAEVFLPLARKSRLSLVQGTLSDALEIDKDGECEVSRFLNYEHDY